LKGPKEFIRYAVVGATTNVFGFLLYVLFTSLGVSPVMTISIFYPVHIGTAFYLNKKWSFNHKGQLSTSAFRYVTAYAGCYALNVAILKLFSDYLDYSHLVVQAIAVVLIALLLFLTQKYWIFRVQESAFTHLKEL
jgi:putative flippase GtrA